MPSSERGVEDLTQRLSAARQVGIIGDQHVIALSTQDIQKLLLALDTLHTWSAKPPEPQPKVAQVGGFVDLEDIVRWINQARHLRPVERQDPGRTVRYVADLRGALFGDRSYGLMDLNWDDLVDLIKPVRPSVRETTSGPRVRISSVDPQTHQVPVGDVARGSLVPITLDKETYIRPRPPVGSRVVIRRQRGHGAHPDRYRVAGGRVGD